MVESRSDPTNLPITNEAILFYLHKPTLGAVPWTLGF